MKNENDFSDIDEPVINDSLEEVSQNKESIKKHKGYDPTQTNEILLWAGRRFANPLKQKKHIANMLVAGYTPDEIKVKWKELEDDEFWSNKGIDFSIVSSQIDKKRSSRGGVTIIK